MTRGPIMIMAGGTGGHIFPGLAVAEALQRKEMPVVWLGTRRGLEAQLVPERGIDIEWINIHGFRGRGPIAWLLTPVQLVRSIWQVFGAFRRRRPQVVLGLGGFVSAPGGIAAWLTRRPLIIHEQNAVAGTANRMLAPLARQVFAAFPNSFPRNVRYTVVGNPVRAAIAAVPVPKLRFANRGNRRLRVLIVGGSQGARVFNQIVPAAMTMLESERRPEIWHQAGRGLDEATATYAANRVEARIDAFIEDMAAAYAWADIVVARAGALTVAELEAAGLGALLVPYPHAIDDHQTRNAEHFCAAGAGIVMPETQFSAKTLAAELSRLDGDRHAVLEMAEKARAQAQTSATEQLVDACLAAAGGRT